MTHENDTDPLIFDIKINPWVVYDEVKTPIEQESLRDNRSQVSMVLIPAL